MLSATALPLAGCFGFDHVVKRIKIIAMAEVDGKPVEGSTVMEITWRPRGDGGMNVDHLGEAVVLELAGRGTIFMLPMIMFKNGLDSSGIWGHEMAQLLGIKGSVHKNQLNGIVELKGRYPFKPLRDGTAAPLMVAFKDENEFRSIYRVEPEKFSEHFGSGVKFVGVDFEITDEPVTKVLVKRLPILTRLAANAPESLRRVAYVDMPFKYKIGTKSFFAIGRY
jgi:hypothetical protein